MNVLTITGDRQSGKSYTLRQLAIDAATQGESVLFACESQNLAMEQFRIMRDTIAPELVEKVYLANGNECITLIGGGCIYFNIAAHRRRTTVRLLDNVDHPDLYIGAERIIRTVLE